MTGGIPRVAVCLLIVGAAVASPALGAAPRGAPAEDASAAPPGNASTTEGANVTVTRTGPGMYRIDVGEDDPRMAIRLNLSLFVSPWDGGVLRVRSFGVLDGSRVVGAAVSLSFDGIGDPASFAAAPLSRFSFGGRSYLRLPFLDDDPSGGER